MIQDDNNTPIDLIKSFYQKIKALILNRYNNSIPQGPQRKNDHYIVISPLKSFKDKHSEEFKLELICFNPAYAFA